MGKPAGRNVSERAVSMQMWRALVASMENQSRVVECAAIDAAEIGEPLEGDIKLCRASRTGVDMKTLATALGGVGVN